LPSAGFDNGEHIIYPSPTQKLWCALAFTQRHKRHLSEPVVKAGEPNEDISKGYLMRST